jgi:L-seryl-tRNA(Ser) seleniumtransferase
MRAVRVDKLTLSVLAETLAMLRDPQKWEHSLPALRLIRRPLDELRLRAGQIAESLQSVAGFAAISVVDSEASVGGGSAPGHAIPSIAIRVQPSTISEGDLCERLRAGRPGVIARASDGAVLLDLRTVHDDEFDALVAALREALGTPLRPTGRSSILGPE